MGQCRIISLLKAGLFSSIKFMMEYLVGLDEQELASKRPNENRRNNHCVYEKRLDGENLEGGLVTIYDLLKGSNEDRTKGVVIITAPSDGYAKDFFAVRIVTKCYDLLKEEADGILSYLRILLKESARYYFPIIIDQDVIEDSGEIDDQNWLFKVFADSIRRKCASNEWNDAKKCEKLNKFLKLMVMEGHILLLLPRGSLETTAGLFTLLIDTLVGDNKGNLVIYVADDENISCDPQYCYLVQLGNLTKEEILEHIDFVTSKNEKLLFFF